MTSSCKERPILFSAPMVRTLLAGTKTQTRRVCKPAEAAGLSFVVEVPDPLERGQVYNGSHFGNEEGGVQFACPYGGVGDRLWVRETHAPQADCWGSWERWLRGAGGEPPIIHYAADFKPFQNDNGFVIRKPFIEKWRPSIHMPRWASRIDLEVTDVRVERLQEISEADARAEGAPPSHPSLDRISCEFGYADFPRSWYAQLWETINGAGSWAANPFVWAISFRRFRP